ncbi:MAG: excinuclease ABC subunit C [Candidatus Buchananbacteria bacterium RBG_13_36_9]|uniref:Excinuclease ABC subunit C n=1 Tax=Candidatus Buchananbacteria bacterium RBG_13_36_9 TaxID=1797530 RepID=A0A1G1XNV6_9BACT|nr:MAG: excinuclease ABC subunit C [Candidatus Buchananbacteria bacterium RBG_13_36_9]
MDEKSFAVYIMMNKMRTVNYVGVTSDLVGRVWQHKNKIYDGFTKRYNVNRLVYYECFETAESAIFREKEIKGWSRAKKLKLIESTNPYFKDLYEGIIQ